MSVVRQTLPHPVHDVFEVLIDPYTYPEWLVGCKEMRAVDADWPQVGSRFHHRVGLLGPLTVDDSSRVLDIEDGRRLELEVRARPLGRGRVTFTLAASRSGSADDTVLAIDEVPIGAMSRVKPLLDPLVTARNTRSLANLARFLDDQRQGPATS